MSLTPEIRDITCDDIPGIAHWKPRPEDLYAAIDIIVGVKGEEGASNFQLVVASEEALKRRGCRDASRALIQDAFDWTAVLRYNHEKVGASSGDSWNEIGKKLCRYFFWEYENYRVEDPRGSRTPGKKSKRRAAKKRDPGSRRSEPGTRN